MIHEYAGVCSRELIRCCSLSIVLIQHRFCVGRRPNRPSVFLHLVLLLKKINVSDTLGTRNRTRSTLRLDRKIDSNLFYRKTKKEIES